MKVKKYMWAKIDQFGINLQIQQFNVNKDFYLLLQEFFKSRKLLLLLFQGVI